MRIEKGVRATPSIYRRCRCRLARARSLGSEPGGGYSLCPSRRSAGLPRALEHTNAEHETMSEMESLRDLYVEEIKDLYSAEKQILQALPRMIKAATHP